LTRRWGEETVSGAARHHPGVQPVRGGASTGRPTTLRNSHSAKLLPVLLCTFLAGCGEEETPSVSTEGSTPSESVPANATPHPNLLESSRFNTASVRTTGRVIVRDGPDAATERMGLIARDTRLKPLSLNKGPGCEQGWVEIDADRWVCGKNLEPDERAPEATEYPAVEEGQVIPAVYGNVLNSNAVVYASIAAIKKGQSSRQLSGHTVVLRVEETDVDGRLFWKIASGEYMLASDLKPYKPSDFHGVFLGKGIDLPLVFIMPGANFEKPAIESPNIVPLAAGRGIARVLEKVPLGKAASGQTPPYKFRIGENDWVSGSLIRFAQEVPAPEDIQPDERWVDINLKQQVLVAYEGFQPVYATLISSGRLDPTPRGIFRIYLKYGETSMGSEMGDDRPYLIENVPWTQFFQAGIALHCAFWHNGFGYPRSRGCVNLAPIDARFVYNWATPQPPLGWTSLHAYVDHPGTLVRVWQDEAEPLYYYGYARDVAKARGVKVKGAPSLKEQMEQTKAETLKRNGPPKPADKPAEKVGGPPGLSPAAEGGDRLSEGDKPSGGAAPRP